MPEPFLGEIRTVSFAYAPKSWALCDGSLLQISQNQALFALLSTTYGGDGQTTFGLPDLRGRSPLHFGTGLSPYALGQQTGLEGVILTTDELPSHTHAVQASSQAGTTSSPGGAVLAAPAEATALYAQATPNVQLNSATLQSTGNSTPHENRQPFLAVNHIICLSGIFPPRS